MLFNVCLPRIGIPIPVAPLRSLASVTGVLAYSPLMASDLKILAYVDNYLLCVPSGTKDTVVSYITASWECQKRPS